MKREHLLFALSTAASIGVAALILQALEPRLFSRPKDLQVIQLDTSTPPFLENIFREEDRRSVDLLLNDPVTVVRGRPLLPEVAGMGPHDALGFRNRSVPAAAAVVTIGDSQTYGNNAPLEESWPAVLARGLGPTRPVYSMAVGGWSPVQYVAAVRAATYLKPRFIIVAIYEGNDLLEAARTAYAIPYWKDLRKDGGFSAGMVPGYPQPAPERDILKLLPAGVPVQFNPALRLLANDRSSRAVQEGLRITIDTLRLMKSESDRSGAKLLLMLIPTKELVYAPVLTEGGTALPPEFERLATDEDANRVAIVDAASAAGISGVMHPLQPLTDAASDGAPVYPPDQDGHPLPLGYRIIGNVAAEYLIPRLPPISDGLYAVQVGDSDRQLFQVRSGERRRVAADTPGINPSEAVQMSMEELMAIPLAVKSG